MTLDSWLSILWMSASSRKRTSYVTCLYVYDSGSLGVYLTYQFF